MLTKRALSALTASARIAEAEKTCRTFPIRHPATFEGTSSLKAKLLTLLEASSVVSVMTRERVAAFSSSIAASVSKGGRRGSGEQVVII
jgi:hypothetical protein